MSERSESDRRPSFTFGAYLRDKGIAAAVGILCVLGIFGMCMVLGVGTDASVTVSAFALLCLCLVLAFEYGRRARFWREAEDLEEASCDACALPSLLPSPAFLEGEIAQSLAEHISLKASAELTAAHVDAEGYREYVELWIHEAKTPIAAAKLVLDRMTGEDADALSWEIERIDNQVEQALYYARSTAPQKDYAIRSIPLAQAAREACKRQARFLVEKQAIPAVDIPDDMEVLSDEPWLVFMFGQVLANAAQYGAHSIRFVAHEEDVGTPHGKTVLEIRDDGCGISQADMPRIFDRGFTGSNGRASGTATGMGLYLIALMCQRLGLGVSAASEEGVGTRILFSFPHNRRFL